MSFFDGSGYADLLNTTTSTTDSLTVGQLTLPNQDPNAILVTDANSNVTDLVLTNGQIIIGSTGAAPVASTITGTAHEIIVTNASGSITLSTPQPIDTTSNVIFANITDSGLAPSYPILTNSFSQLVSGFISLNNDVSGVLPIVNGGTNSATPLAGGDLMISSGGAIIEGTSATAPSFSGTLTAGQIIDSGLTATELVATNGSKQLESVTITNSNANGNTSTLSFTGSTLTMASTMSQDVSATGAPTFSNITDNGLAPSHPILTNSFSQLVSGFINLTADVSGVLPVANGGTNSSTALSNGDIMISSGGKIIEGTSATSPSFSGTLSAGQIIDSGLTASLPVHTNGSKQLITGAISLTTDVSGVLQIGSGGTNSGTALTNGNIMVSSAGTIIEGTSSTSPSFSGTLTAGQIIDSGLTATELVATNGSKQLESVTITNANGTNMSFSGSTLANTMTQNLGTSGSPSFTQLGLTQGMTQGVLMYQTGTITQSGTTVTGSGTTFTSAMVGGVFVTQQTAATTISAFSSTTQLSVVTSATISSGVKFVIFYSQTSTTGGYALSLDGHSYQQAYGIASKPTTVAYYGIQNSGGGNSMAFDYQTYSVGSGNAPNGRMQIVDNAFGADFQWLSRKTGSDSNALQTNFTLGANRSVVTANSTLDDGAGNMTIGNSITVDNSIAVTQQISMGLLGFQWPNSITENIISASLSSIQILTLNSAPVQILPAVSGQVYIITQFFWNLVFNSVAYTGGGIVTPNIATLPFTSGMPVNDVHATNSVFGFSSGLIQTLNPATYKNQPVKLTMATGNPAAGNSTLFYAVRYYLMPVS